MAATFRGAWQGEREEKEPGILHVQSQSQLTAHISLLADSILKGPLKVCTTTSVCWELCMQRH